MTAVFFASSVTHNDVTAECGNAPARPFGSLVDAAAALRAHARQPQGRVVNLQNAAVEDEQAREEWLAERRRQHAEYKARLKAIQEATARIRAREADARRRARIKAKQAEYAQAVTQ